MIDSNETKQRKLPVWSGEFPQSPGLIYLNHAAVSPWPHRTAEAVGRFAAENVAEGSRHYPRWLQTEAALREQLMRLLNAPSRDDIALLKNTSEGLSLVAYGLPWRRGDNVVSARGEFPSNRIVWESLAARGVELRLADLGNTSAPEDALFALTDRRTRLLAISSVQYATGMRMDLERIGRFCRRRGVLFCVDAIQSLGALPLDVQACEADFVVADGHKWMMAPEGVAVFFSRAPAREELQLCQYGWHMVANPGDFDSTDWRVAGDARRFECGSPNMLGIHALHASLSLIEEVGMDSISQRILDNTRMLGTELASTPGLRILSSRSPDRLSGIITFVADKVESATLVQQLWSRGIITAARGGGVRLSPHFYTSQSQLETAIAALKSLSATPSHG